MQVPIRKQQQGEDTVFVVPAVAIAIAGGDKKLIPNPAGNEVCAYPTLEAARAAVERAGFDAIYDGVTTVNMGQMARQKAQPPHIRPPRLTHTLTDQLRQKLLALLTDREPQVVVAAVQALASWQYIPAVSELCRQLGHNDPTVRKEVATALARLNPHSIPALKEAYRVATGSIEAHAPYIRAAVLLSFQAMLQDNPQEHVDLIPTVLMGLTDDHWMVRSQAATTASFIKAL
jgi:HEAT repeats